MCLTTSTNYKSNNLPYKYGTIKILIYCCILLDFSLWIVLRFFFMNCTMIFLYEFYYDFSLWIVLSFLYVLYYDFSLWNVLWFFFMNCTMIFLHELYYDPRTSNLYQYVAELLVEWDMFQTDIVEKISSFQFNSVSFFSLRINAFYEIMWKIW
jgi:hypothetical protein